MSVTVNDVMNILTTPKLPIENTVDGLVCGEPAAEITGIATAFLATQEVIETAIRLHLNLIVSHEGIFFSHSAGPERLYGDRVFQNKRALIAESGMAVIRYHDYIHRTVPDGITAGLLEKLGWRGYEIENKQFASILELPETPVGQLVLHIKERLGAPCVRLIGNAEMKCRKIAVLVGYRGAEASVLPLFESGGIDLAVYGEGPEWETPEYVRDAAFQGENRAAIVLGHGESEMPGMESLARRLREELPGVPVRFIPNSPLFQVF